MVAVETEMEEAIDEGYSIIWRFYLFFKKPSAYVYLIFLVEVARDLKRKNVTRANVLKMGDKYLT